MKRCVFVTGLLLLALTSACAESDSPLSPTSPTAFEPDSFPALEGAATRYRFSRPLTFEVTPDTRLSDFTLYDNGAFTIRYPPPRTQTIGAYEAGEDGDLTLLFSDPDFTATGVLKRDSLEVRYAPLMRAEGFEDAVYTRASGGQAR